MNENFEKCWLKYASYMGIICIGSTQLEYCIDSIIKGDYWFALIYLSLVIFWAYIWYMFYRKFKNNKKK